MGKAENDVETYLTEQIELRGGFTRKWVSPGHSNVQDRICFLPGGEVWFIEVKATGELPTREQFREIFKQRNLGHNAGFIAGRYDVKRFMESDFKEAWMTVYMSKYANPE